MLLTSLQRHTQGAVSICVYSNTNDSSRHTSFILSLVAKKSGVWTTISRNTKTLCSSRTTAAPISPGGVSFTKSKYQQLRLISFSAALAINAA
jgi:hypothetical protein